MYSKVYHNLVTVVLVGKSFKSSFLLSPPPSCPTCGGAWSAGAPQDSAL